MVLPPQIAIGLSLLLLSLFTFLLGMLAGALIHRRYQAAKERSSEATYVPIVTNTMITDPQATHSLFSDRERTSHAFSPSHNQNQESILASMELVRSGGVGVLESIREGLGNTDMETTSVSQDEEFESPHYGNTTPKENSNKPVEAGLYKNIQRHSTDVQVGKALSCDNLQDNKNTLQKSCSLEILSSRQEKCVQPEEQLYEDVDVVVARKVPPHSLPPNYDYVSSGQH